MAKRVLVIDDDADFLETTRLTIESAGYAVDTAPTGSEGLEQVKERRPDLIVLDVMMPGMDGWEVCEALKEDDQTAGIPVIMLTAVASQVRSTTYTHGPGKATDAEDYIPKPVEPAYLVTRIEKLLGRSGGSGG